MKRYVLFALSACVALASAAAAYVVSAIERGIAFAFNAIASPLTRAPSFDRLVPSGPALAYDGPPVHFTRHEAGVSRRSAARHT